jgi:hypothetical protein
MVTACFSFMLELRVRGIGNALGVVLPEETVNRLRAAEGSPLFLIENSDRTYQLTSHDPCFEKMLAQAEQTMGRYRHGLHLPAT